MAYFFFLVGPAGSGKTTVGSLIKKKQKFKFFEGDKFHTKKSINKMREGLKLNLSDRLPWLKKINPTL